jgi:type VI secretion system protein ImpG
MARLPYTDLRDLLSSAETFSAALPALAGALAETTTDAPLERAREGLFYLGASCMDRVRELESEGQRALAESVAPEVLRPFPAATILELSSDSVRRVPAGAEVTTEGTAVCRFRTTSDLRLAPWHVDAARVERSAERPHTLCFDLVATGDLSLGEAVGNIRPRFFVGGPDALSLVAHVLSHTTRAEIVLEDSDAALSLGEVLPYGTRPDQALAAEPDGPHTGLTLLREYFLLPEKFCFFALGGLTAALRDSAARRATVTLTFGKPLPPPVTSSPSIRAHCVPAINLFAATAEPWIFELGRSSAPLRVAGTPRNQGGIYAVSGVSALSCKDGEAEPIALAAARRFAAGALSESFPYAYSTKLVTVPGQTEPEVVLCLTSPRGQAPALSPHVISTQLLATNRARAARLRPGELCARGPGMPSGVRVRNVTTTSPYVPPPTPIELARHVAIRAAVPDGDALYALRSRLLALVPRRGADQAVVRAHVARVLALQHLEAGVALDRAGSRRGYEVRVTIDETPFSGLGDVALFVRLLSAALEAQTSIGHFVRVAATCTKSGARLAWPAEEQP